MQEFHSCMKLTSFSFGNENERKLAVTVSRKALLLITFMHYSSFCFNLLCRAKYVMYTIMSSR